MMNTMRGFVNALTKFVGLFVFSHIVDVVTKPAVTIIMFRLFCIVYIFIPKAASETVSVIFEGDFDVPAFFLGLRIL